MRTINTLAELKEERLRLQMRKTFLEAEIKTNFNEIKEQLKPLKLVAKGATKFFAGKDHSVAGDTAGYLTNVLVKEVLLKNAGYLSRLVLPYLAKNVATNAVDDNKAKISDWIQGIIAKFTHKKAEANA
jgi:hypothetical protein